jgi:hypothetical protein
MYSRKFGLRLRGKLPRAAALLGPLHPNVDNGEALVTQVYQAMLERRPAQVIPRLQEILAEPDPELRFWLGWAQEVAGDHAAAQESWRRARSEYEFSLKEQPENDQLMGYLALTNMGLGDKAAGFKLVERNMATNPIAPDLNSSSGRWPRVRSRRTRSWVHVQSRSSLGWRRARGNSTAPSPL